MPAPGFAPIRFRVAGWLLIAGGSVGLLLKAVSHFSAGAPLPQELVYFGLALIVVGLYLTLVAARSG